MAPALDQETTRPSRSVIVMIVLLNVDWTWATPVGTFFFSFFLRVLLRIRSFAMVARPRSRQAPLLGRRRGLLGPDGRPLLAAAGPGVGVRALSAHRQVAP